MNPVAWLVGLVLPACGFPGAQGLPPPPLMDTAHIERPSSPNTALAAPDGFSPKPDIVTPIYKVPAGRAVRRGAGRRRGPAAHVPGGRLIRRSSRRTTWPAARCSISPT